MQEAIGAFFLFVAGWISGTSFVRALWYRRDRKRLVLLRDLPAEHWGEIANTIEDPKLRMKVLESQRRVLS